MTRIIKNFQKYHFLLGQLIKKDIKLKYKGSYLGVLWTLIEPLLTMIVLSVVFSELYGRTDRTFPVYILTGRLLYSFFANSTKKAMRSIRANSSMIKKVYVPKYMYPLSEIMSNFIIFAISLIVLVGVAIVLRVQPTRYILLSVIPLLLLFIMATGIGLILSTLAVFFRDLEYLWEVGLMIIMYCSAIFYSPDMIMKKRPTLNWIFDVNPLYAAIRNFRNTILYGEGFHQQSIIYLLCFSIATLLIGMYIFYKKQDDFILNI